MANWFLAPSLISLRKEVDAIWPNRDKASDGAKGDDAHAKRLSEHNPDERGCVHAIDIDVDGIDYVWVRDVLIKDWRVWYVVSDRKIYSRSNNFVPKDYVGDPHTSHLHVSLRMEYEKGTSLDDQFRAENDTRRWLPDYPEEDIMPNLTEDQLRKLVREEVAKSVAQQIPAISTSVWTRFKGRDENGNLIPVMDMANTVFRWVRSQQVTAAKPSLLSRVFRRNTADTGATLYAVSETNDTLEENQ